MRQGSRRVITLTHICNIGYAPWMAAFLSPPAPDNHRPRLVFAVGVPGASTGDNRNEPLPRSALHNAGERELAYQLRALHEGPDE